MVGQWCHFCINIILNIILTYVMPVFLSNTVLSTLYALNYNVCSQQLCVHYYYSHFIGEEIGAQKVKQFAQDENGWHSYFSIHFTTFPLSRKSEGTHNVLLTVQKMYQKRREIWLFLHGEFFGGPVTVACLCLVKEASLIPILPPNIFIGIKVPLQKRKAMFLMFQY